MNHFKI